ncbi:hypothetical protein [Dictyobacter formicarum]|uniref:CARDB domain-containing protein n=1 Tax=Dictyobacter formicarum TaxID=2778368 RepID=A0ABQ3VST4_9CHLR|nr:hypothetical protein [Dictyobacter formicarum]GHO88689.1 hypothetical protein KSZ_66950 [Dictyobacter formicarum]
MPQTFHHNDEPRAEEGQRGYTPYLYIPYNGTDTGNRPLGPNIKFWGSPHIAVSHTDQYGNVVPGQPITITARVFNGGLKPALPFITVQFFVFNSSLAFTTANSLFTATIQPTKQIPSKGYIEVSSPTPWIPEPVENGHPCIVVQCSTPEEGTDSLKFPFFAALDRHVAQRNMTVANPVAGQKLILHAGNPFHQSLPCTLRVSSLLIHGKFEELRRTDVGTLMTLLANVQPGAPGNLLEQRLEVRTKDISGEGLDVRLEQIEHQDVPGDQGEVITLDRYLQQRMQSDPNFDPQSLGKVLGEFVLEPRTANNLLIAVAPTDLGGADYIVHHFTQVVENCPIGGYTLVVPPMNF